MRKFLFVYLILSLLGETSLAASESPKKLRFSMPTFSSSRPVDYLLKGILGTISLVELWILKTYILSRYRHSNMKDLKEEFSWVTTNYDVENYPDGVPEILLKFRKQLFFGFKDLLHQFQEEMDIKDPNCVNYLITEAEGEDYLQTNRGRKRFVDKNIPGEILDFIDESLEQININPRLVDVYGKSPKNLESGTSSHTSFIQEKRNHENLYFNEEILSEYSDPLKEFKKFAPQAFPREDLLLAYHQLVQEEKISFESKQQKMANVYYSFEFYFFYVTRELYHLHSNILHENGHILSNHSFITGLLTRESLFNSKEIPEDFMNRFRRYKEFMADALLPLLYKKAVVINLKNWIIKELKTHNKTKTMNIISVEEKPTGSYDMSFILYTDIAKLHKISLKDSIFDSLQEIYLMNTTLTKSDLNERSDLIYTQLENIYNSADPEFYVQTYKKEDGTEEIFKFPRFLPHLLEK